MSTRSSIWYKTETLEEVGFHLYHEMLEDGAICLEISWGPFQCTVKLPEELVAALQRGKPAGEGS